MRDDIGATVSLRGPGDGGSGSRLSARAYLLVLEGDTSTVFHLPAEGVVLIGRGEEVDLSLADTAVSRRHARLMLTAGEARVVDLDSHNGTLVNAERIDGARVLASGDVVTICGATLVLHRGRSPQPERSPLDPLSLRRRLEEERSRALAYGRHLALACLRVSGADTAAVAGQLLRGVRLIDVVGISSAGDPVVLFPELDGDLAASAAGSLLETLRTAGHSARAGVSVLGVDGTDVDTLLEIARAAADAAAPGTVGAGPDHVQRLEIGDRQVLLADPAMAAAYGLLRRLAASALPVLVLGETGVGKENAAFSVHAWSPRQRGPFVTVNCAAIPEGLFESELFGHERGAFSGAVAAKVGVLEAASGGTLFLDEVGELPAAAQAKLLRVLEVGRITRVGEVRERPVDLRLVAATNRDLEVEVAAGRFRRDLYFRLGAATVILPPLRDRRREIPLLARAFLAAASARLELPAPGLSAAALERLAAHDWPGNVRELKNAMEYAAATAGDQPVEPWHLPARLAGQPPPPAAAAAAAAASAAAEPRSFRPIAEEVEELERRRMTEALAATDGVQTRAAELISMPLRTFQQRLKDYGIARRRP